MTGEENRFIRQAAQIADWLEPYIKNGRLKHSGSGEGERSSPNAPSSTEPVSIPLISALEEFDHNLAQELGIRKAVLEQLDGRSPNTNVPDRTTGAALLSQLLGDAPQPVVEHTLNDFRRHKAVLILLKATVAGHPARRCPAGHRQQEPWERIPANTLIPASLLGGRANQLVCVHPECEAEDGTPRVISPIELMTGIHDRLVTAADLGVLLGCSEPAARARIRRAEAAGHRLPVIDTVGPAGSAKNRWRLGDLLNVASIRRGLGLAP